MPECATDFTAVTEPRSFTPGPRSLRRRPVPTTLVVTDVDSSEVYSLWNVMLKIHEN